MSPISIDIELLDVIPPFWSSDAEISGTLLVLSAESEEPGSAFYVVMEQAEDVMLEASHVLDPSLLLRRPLFSGEFEIEQADTTTTNTQELGYSRQVVVFLVVTDVAGNHLNLVNKSPVLATPFGPPPPPPAPPPPPEMRIERDTGLLMTMFAGTYSFLGVCAMALCIHKCRYYASGRYAKDLATRRSVSTKKRSLMGKHAALAKARAAAAKSASSSPPPAQGDKGGIVKGYANYEQYDVMESGGRAGQGMHFQEVHTDMDAKQLSRERRLDALMHLSRQQENTLLEKLDK
jgi:hypothetical protein